MRIAVIGGTASGPAAAAEAVRSNPDAEVVLYEQGDHISVGSCEIPYMVGGWIEDWRRLEILTPKQFERSRGGTVRVRHRVRDIRPRDRRLTVEALDFGSVHEERFDRFILAVGARPRQLGIEGEDAPNVFPVRSLEGARTLRRWLDTESVRHAVIVGGGHIGVEMAEVLRARGIRVSILEVTGRVLGAALSPGMCEPFQKEVRAAGVAIRAERPVRFALDRHGRVNAVHTDHREIIGCDLVIVAIGLVPRTELATTSGVKQGSTGALAVDDGMQTNVGNVWACGDCVEFRHVVTGRPVYAPLAPLARRSARVAARNATRRGGRKATFAPITRVAGVAAFGMEAAHAGLTESEAQAAGFDVMATEIRQWSRASLYPGAQPLHVRIVAERGTGRLLGGELVGAEGAGLRANTLGTLILGGYTARQVVEEVEFLYNPPMAPANDPLLVACSQAAKAAEAATSRRARGGG
jgi:CoA-dependent NAD(P)H sulfur oxidoreductase